MARALVFVGILSCHWIAQFIAWASADRINPWRFPWNVLSAPLFYVSKSLANEHFWAVAGLNSVVWAIALSYGVNRLKP